MAPPTSRPRHSLSRWFVISRARQMLSVTCRDWRQLTSLPLSSSQKGSRWMRWWARLRSPQYNRRAAKWSFLSARCGLGSLRLLPEHLCRLSWAAALHSIKRDPPAPRVYELVLLLSPADSGGHPAAQQRHLFYESAKLHVHFILAFFLPCKHRKETL